MNNDLVSRSALIAEFERIYAEHYKCACYQFIHDIFKAMFRRLKNAPALDAVEVVRCKDCIHYEPCESGKDFCCWHAIGIVKDDFCSYGERREHE